MGRKIIKVPQRRRPGIDNGIYDLGKQVHLAAKLMRQQTPPPPRLAFSRRTVKVDGKDFEVLVFDSEELPDKFELIYNREGWGE